MPRRESSEQGAFFNFVNFLLPQEVSALITHIPNGEHRDPRVAVKLKQMGVKPHWPDILVAIPRGGYCGLFIELKRAKGGKVDAGQERLHNMLKASGYRVEVCRGAERAITTLTEYLDE